MTSNNPPTISIYLELECAHEIPSLVMNTLVFLYTDIASLLEECINIAWHANKTDSLDKVETLIMIDCSDSLHTIVDYGLSEWGDTQSHRLQAVLDNFNVYVEAMTHICLDVLCNVVNLLEHSCFDMEVAPHVVVNSVVDVTKPTQGNVVKRIPQKMRISISLADYVTYSKIQYKDVPHLKYRGGLL